MGNPSTRGFAFIHPKNYLQFKQRDSNKEIELMSDSFITLVTKEGKHVNIKFSLPSVGGKSLVKRVE